MTPVTTSCPKGRCAYDLFYLVGAEVESDYWKINHESSARNEQHCLRKFQDGRLGTGCDHNGLAVCADTLRVVG